MCDPRRWESLGTILGLVCNKDGIRYFKIKKWMCWYIIAYYTYHCSDFKIYLQVLQYPNPDRWCLWTSPDSGPTCVDIFLIRILWKLCAVTSETKSGKATQFLPDLPQSCSLWRLHPFRIQPPCPLGIPHHMERPWEDASVNRSSPDARIWGKKPFGRIPPYHSCSRLQSPLSVPSWGLWCKEQFVLTMPFTNPSFTESMSAIKWLLLIALGLR